MLASILPDEKEMPEVAEVMAPLWDYFREVAGGLSAGWGVTDDAQRFVRAAVGHALGFYTWNSLTDAGLSDGEAAELMVGLVADVAARTGNEASSALRSDP